MSTAPNRSATPQRKRYGVCTGDKDPNCKKCKSKETQEFSAIDKFECKECGSTVRQVPPPPPPTNWKKYALIGVGILALGGGGFALFKGSGNDTATEGKSETPQALVSTSIDSIKPAIIVEPVEVTDTMGKTIEIKATPTPSDAAVTWKTSDPAIAMVDGGHVALLKEGKAEITCSLNDTIKATTAVTVVKKKEQTPTGGDVTDPNYVRNYSLPYGTYEGPATGGVPNGLNGVVKVTKGFNLDLKSGGTTLRLEPGDMIVSCKFRNGKTVQGFLKRANGEGKNFNIGI